MLNSQENFCQRPLLSELVQNTAASYVLQEKLFSLSGEVCATLSITHRYPERATTHPRIMLR